MDCPTLRTGRLILRCWTDSDLPAYAELNSDPEVMAHFPSTLTRVESDTSAARIRQHMTENGFGFWAVEIPGEAKFAGFVGLSTPAFAAHFTPCVEIGWRLHHTYWNRGYATEAAREAAQFAFGTLALGEIVSFTAVGNRPSRRVMAKLGMGHDPRDDFDHPLLAAGHPLQRHVLYRLNHRGARDT